MPPPAPIKPQMKPMRMPQTMDWMARFFAPDPLHGLFGGHDGPDDELDAQQEGHEHRETAIVAEGSRLATQLPTTVNTSTLTIMMRPFLMSRFLFLW